MLASLLEIPGELDPIGVEETRMRAATLLCKVQFQYYHFPTSKLAEAVWRSVVFVYIALYFECRFTKTLLL